MVIRVLELFSGIGGMHCALKRSRVNADVVAAMDINGTANLIYRDNFKDTAHLERNICGLTSHELNELGPNMLLMSPPCQPFTRQGLMNDVDDNRSQPLLHIISLIPNMHSLNYILLENVKGFETSLMRDRVLATLEACGFVYQEFLISPKQLGIPNSRLRYYLIAKRNEAFSFQVSKAIITELSSLNEQMNYHSNKLENYLQQLNNEEISQYNIPDSMLLKYAEVMDVVDRQSTNSCCFTKAYGRYLKGTGSVLQESGDLSSVYQRQRECESLEGRLEILKELKLRFFTPKEIARLLGFDDNFQLNDQCTLNQKYKALGNSLNVEVVALLIQLLVN